MVFYKVDSTKFILRDSLFLLRYLYPLERSGINLKKDFRLSLSEK